MGRGRDEEGVEFAEQDVELMEDKEHLGKTGVGARDVRSDLLAIAVLAEPAAARAKTQLDGEDKFGQVKKYAGRLMGVTHQDGWNTACLDTLPAVLKAMDKDPPEQKESKKSAGKTREYVVDMKKRLLHYSMLRNAI